MRKPCTHMPGAIKAGCDKNIPCVRGPPCALCLRACLGAEPDLRCRRGLGFFLGAQAPLLRYFQTCLDRDPRQIRLLLFFTHSFVTASPSSGSETQTFVGPHIPFKMTR